MSARCFASLLVLSACAGQPVLPDFGEVPAFSLVDQTGAGLGRDQLLGSVWVANFIFTSCGSVCPRLSATMADVVRVWAHEPGLRFVSFTVDPETDTPEVLLRYSQGLGADPARWSFLTGPPAEVRTVVVGGMKQLMERLPPGSPDSVMHGERFVLVGKQGTIRAFPDPKEPDLASLHDGIRSLLAE